MLSLRGLPLSAGERRRTALSTRSFTRTFRDRLEGECELQNLCVV